MRPLWGVNLLALSCRGPQSAQRTRLDANFRYVGRVRADPVELMAPRLSPPREGSPSWGHLLVAGGLGAIGRIRAGAQLLVRVRPLPVLGLPWLGYTGAGGAALCNPPAGT